MFGGGPHYCLGAILARVEMAEAWPVLAQRLPGLVLDGEPTVRAELSGVMGHDAPTDPLRAPQPRIGRRDARVRRDVPQLLRRGRIHPCAGIGSPRVGDTIRSCVTDAPR